MSNKPPAPQAQPTMTYVNRPEISETYVDSCARMTIEGFNGKLEFVVNRMDDPIPQAPPSGKAITAIRLVLPIPGIIDLHARLSQIIGVLQAQGALRQIPMVPGSESGKPN
jgi:hypothetical protein